MTSPGLRMSNLCIYLMKICHYRNLSEKKRQWFFSKYPSKARTINQFFTFKRAQMTMNPKNRSDLGIANSDCSYLSPGELCQNGCCIWVFWWILPTKFHSHSQHEWISPKWLWHMRCPIGTACMGILIKNCVSEICIIIWQVCGAYGVKYLLPSN